MVDLQDICVRYGEKTVLDHVSVHIPKGVHMALMGASGVGKTTLLHIIAGLKKPDSGTVKVIAARSAMLFQQPRLLPWRNAMENVNCVLSDRSATMPQTLEWLRLLGMEKDWSKYPAALSGGMQQRVALARALAFGGELVLLDEPFQGLDKKTKADAMELCREQLKDKTTLLVTHDYQEAQALADRIYIMDAQGLRLEKRYGTEQSCSDQHID